jgi:hypothetical protein
VVSELGELPILSILGITSLFRCAAAMPCNGVGLDRESRDRHQAHSSNAKGRMQAIAYCHSAPDNLR